MRKFNIFTVFFMAALITAAFFSPPALALAEPDIKADAALLVEVKSGTILYEKAKDKRVSPGGISKVMTLLLAIEAVDNGLVELQVNVTASKTFLFGMGINEETLGIRPGEMLTYSDLLYAVCLTSANDACNILAERLSGSISGFVDKMNDKAEALGCSETHFSNTGGMPDPDQYTTAWDQYLILKEAASHPLYLEMAGKLSYQIRATAFSPERNLINQNAMLDSSSDYYFNKSLAGVMDADGNNCITYAQNNELSFVSVIFRAGPAGGGNTENQNYADSKHLLDWGFTGFVWQDIVHNNEIVAKEEIALAKGIHEVMIRPSDTLTILAPSDLRLEDIKKEIVIFETADGNKLSAPLREGNILGEMTIYINGALAGKIKLVAAHNVELNRGAFIQKQILNTLSDFRVLMVIFTVLLLLGIYIWIIIKDRRKRRAKQLKLEKIKQKIIEERQRESIER